MTLRNVQRVYEQLGDQDPLWAVLTDDRLRGNRWDADSFFATGREEIAAAMAGLRELSVPVGNGSALDFGCGVGRLTQALCEHFDQVTGVDISSSMVAQAEGFNRFGPRCRYIVNTTDRIAGIPDASLDFLYSNISLQHSPPRHQYSYLRDFLRMLKPGAVAVFQVRIGPHRPQGSLSERWYRLRSETLRPLGKRLRGRPPVQVHTISEQDVETVIAAAGGRIVDRRNADNVPRRSRRSLRFTVTKPA